MVVIKGKDHIVVPEPDRRGNEDDAAGGEQLEVHAPFGRERRPDARAVQRRRRPEARADADRRRKRRWHRVHGIAAAAVLLAVAGCGGGGSSGSGGLTVEPART